ncbi:hypothetical protein NE237_025698 [Protea cynaroides]|uniref:Uncharacterized protein n=1 Tax=Protea cynaroides TaxID=273540 RepID=A0A9Q0H6Q7_9MAGN|nr:hypothetical protein NE237_025698 [Protea cynaroides]
MVEQGLSSDRRSGLLSGNLTGDWEDLGSSEVMVLQMGSKIPVRLLGAPLSAGGVIDRRLPWCDDDSVLTHEDVLWIAGGLSPVGKHVMAVREFGSVMLSLIEAAGDTMEGDARRGIPSLIQFGAAIELRSSGKQVEELGLNQALSQGTGGDARVDMLRELVSRAGSGSLAHVIPGIKLSLVMQGVTGGSLE